MRRFCVAVLFGVLGTAAYAAPASATATFDGQCSIDGKTNFGLPLQFVAQDMDWTFTSNPGGGKCTGTLNGVAVVDTPMNVSVRAHGPISCGVAGYSLDAPFVGRFPNAVGDRTLTGRLSLGAIAAQNAVYVKGDQGGFAAGRASFFGQNDEVAVLQGCADGHTITTLNVNVLIHTVGPMSG
ncbi:MAG: hypothetical protein QOE06_1122 [Thermoleophilaceae bacterium]|nr:hypothetical protein [Thermoleophilaceae bacterium]